jgi:glycosyltransferase involved in cell wall biosynthesis
MLDITVIILTFNEELNISRCIASARTITNNIFVVDSYSTDNTIAILEDNNINYIQNKWVNYSKQFTYALENNPFNSNWIFRLDADEFFDKNLHSYLINILNDKSISGIELLYRRYFLGKLLKFGHTSFYNLRIFRINIGYIEDKFMDEHIIIKSGNIKKLNVCLYDFDNKDLNLWIAKHNNYSIRETADYFSLKFKSNLNELKSDSYERTLMKKYYYFTPLFIRPLIYFIYRYFFCFGFLDGTQGFAWHILQGFWYRLLIDIKIFEINTRFKSNPILIKDFFKKNYNYDL